MSRHAAFLIFFPMPRPAASSAGPARGNSAAEETCLMDRNIR